MRHFCRDTVCEFCKRSIEIHNQPNECINPSNLRVFTTTDLDVANFLARNGYTLHSVNVGEVNTYYTMEWK